MTLTPKPSLVLLISLPLLLMMSACNKATSVENGASNTAYVSSIYYVSPQSLQVDSFRYDKANRLVYFAQIKFDTTGGAPQAGNNIILFNYNGISRMPYSYSITFTQGGAHQHLLSYDGQNRVVKDSATDGTGYLAAYSYPDNSTACKVNFSNSSTDYHKDTLYMNGGNLAGLMVYYPNDAGTADSLEGALQYSFSSYQNPLYHEGISTIIGPLLHTISEDGFGGWSDFLSRKALTKVSGYSDGLPQGGMTYAINPDSKGRVGIIVPSAMGSQLNGRVIFNYY